MKIKGTQERGKIAVSLPIELDRQLRHEAINRDCTCSEVVEMALRQFFSQPTVSSNPTDKMKET